MLVGASASGTVKEELRRLLVWYRLFERSRRDLVYLVWRKEGVEPRPDVATVMRVDVNTMPSMTKAIKANDAGEYVHLSINEYVTQLVSSVAVRTVCFVQVAARV